MRVIHAQRQSQKTHRSIIAWRRVDQPGMEYCELTSSDARHRLSGTVVGVEEGVRYRIEYSVQCDRHYRTNDGSFENTLRISEQGLVISYPPFWEKIGKRGGRAGAFT